MKDFLRRLVVYLACSLGLAQLLFAQDIARCCSEAAKGQDIVAPAAESHAPAPNTGGDGCSMRLSDPDPTRYAELVGLIRSVSPASQGRFPKEDRIARQWQQLRSEPAFSECDALRIELKYRDGTSPRRSQYRLQDDAGMLLVEHLSSASLVAGEPTTGQPGHSQIEEQVRASGLVLLVVGVTLAWPLYAPDRGLRITPTAVPLLADLLAVGPGMLSGYGVTHAALAWRVATHTESPPEVPGSLSILFFSVGIPLLAAVVTYLAGQRIHISRQGVLSLRFMRSDFLAWDEMENVALATTGTRDSPRYTAARPLRRGASLQLSGTGRRMLIIDEPQLATTKRELKRLFGAFAPEHWQPALERTLEHW